MIELGIKWMILLIASNGRVASIRYLRVIKNLGYIKCNNKKIPIYINNGRLEFNRLIFLEISTIGIETNLTPKKYIL